MRKRKRSAKVYVLPGVERRDMVGQDLPDKEILENAINRGITGVVIAGYNRAGHLYVAASGADIDKNCGLMMRAVRLMTEDIDRG